MTKKKSKTKIKSSFTKSFTANNIINKGILNKDSLDYFHKNFPKYLEKNNQQTL